MAGFGKSQKPFLAIPAVVKLDSQRWVRTLTPIIVFLPFICFENVGPMVAAPLQSVVASRGSLHICLSSVQVRHLVQGVVFIKSRVQRALRINILTMICLLFTTHWQNHVSARCLTLMKQLCLKLALRVSSSHKNASRGITTLTTNCYFCTGSSGRVVPEILTELKDYNLS